MCMGYSRGSDHSYNRLLKRFHLLCLIISVFFELLVRLQSFLDSCWYSIWLSINFFSLELQIDTNLAIFAFG